MPTQIEERPVGVLVDIGGGIAAVAGVATIAAVGNGLGERYKLWRTARKAGPLADKQLLMALNEAYVGAKPTDLNPFPPPGILKRLTKVETTLGDLVESLQPNGMNTKNPGDQLQRILVQNRAIIEALHIDDPTPDAPVGKGKK